MFDLTTWVFALPELRIVIITPAPPGSRQGNRITALRWSRLLRQLGHTVRIAQSYRSQRADLLIALHAVRSENAIREFSKRHPTTPVLIALTGTDLYDEIDTHPSALGSLETAAHLIVLQSQSKSALPPKFRRKTRVIYQSVQPIAKRKPRDDIFEVCVLGHLRDVKDPLRTAQAARLLPEDSNVRVVHIGAALTKQWAKQAKKESAANRRYQWLGEMSQRKAWRIMARCRLLSLTSISEGGANAISEAITASVPVVTSRMDGSIGLLGNNYPGFFEVGDTNGLAELMHRAETDTRFYRRLQSCCAKRKPLFDPMRELQTWQALLAELNDMPNSNVKN